MKVFLYFFISLIIISCSGKASEEDCDHCIGGGKYIQFMNTLDASVPLQGGTVKLTAKEHSIRLTGVITITNNDTIRESFEWTGDDDLIVTRDWYALDLKVNTQPGEWSSFLNVTLAPCSEGTKRKLILVVTNLMILNDIEITQQ